jgi:hypothetical protein
MPCMWWVLTVGTILVGLGGSLGLHIWAAKGRKEMVQSDWFKSALPVFHMICAAVFACGVTLALGSTGALSKFFHKELGRTFMKTFAPDSKSLRFLGSPIIERIRNSAIEAELLRKTPNDTLVKTPDSFFGALDSIIYPMLNEPWRENLNIIYRQEILDRGNDKVIKIIQTSSWVFKNPRGQAINYPIIVDNLVDTVRNTPLGDLVKIVNFRVEDDSMGFPLVYNREKQYVRFTGKFSVAIERSVRVTMTVEKIQPYVKRDLVVAWAIGPTNGMRFEYRHPKHFECDHYFFGFGKEVNCGEEQQEDTKVWCYKGWMLKKQGLFLYWFAE